jgi:hypothetical protein
MNIRREQANHHILKKSRLLQGYKAASYYAALKSLICIESGYIPDMYFSFYQRMNSFLAGDLEKDIYTSKKMARVRGLKNSMMLVPADMFPPIFSISKDMREERAERALGKWGITTEEFSRLKKSIIESLGNKEKTLQQLKNSIPAGISRDIVMKKGKKKEMATNVAIAAGAMWDRWTLLRGGIGRLPGEDPGRYSLFSNRFKGLKLNIEKSDALSTLAHEYIKNYGPVTVEDFSWWCGVTMNESTSAINSLEGVVSVSIEGSDALYFISHENSSDLSKESIDSHSAIFLPKDDPYIKAYHNVERMVPEGFEGSLITKFGESISTVLIDGIVWGTWAVKKERWGDVCRVEMFEGFEDNENIIGMIRKEAQNAGNFYTDDIFEVEIII